MHYLIRYLSFIALAIVLFGCSTRGLPHSQSSTASTKVTKHNSANTSNGKNKRYTHPTMRSYTVAGKRYHPTVVQKGETFQGVASWYGPNFHGKKTSNGEKYNMYAMTAAHKTLPMNTVLRVSNKKNGRSVVVRINDRGPFVKSRIIDLSKAAAKKLDMLATGTAPVALEILGFSSSKKAEVSHSLPTRKVLSTFNVQIGSFLQFNGAFKTVNKYAHYQGYNATIKDTQYNNKRVFKVWLTGFKSEEEAKDFIAREDFNGAFVVRE